MAKYPCESYPEFCATSPSLHSGWGLKNFHLGTYEYGGIYFWGSPWVPDLAGHAFYRSEHQRQASWDLIPAHTDVLMTHVPPAGILANASSGRDFGCLPLRLAVERVRPRLHCFGHVHNSRGQLEWNGTMFINASSIQRGKVGVEPPFVIEL